MIYIMTYYLIDYYVLFYCLSVLCTQRIYIELDVCLAYVMLIVNKL